MGIPNLNTTTQTTLAAKIILSASYFQASTAELIGAEGAKLQRMITAASAGSISINALTTANKGIRSTIVALSTLENSIMQKIVAGTHLHNTKNLGW